MSATRSTSVKRISISDLQVMRDKGQPITMVTAYDYPSARVVDQAGLPIILVGDSLGMVVLGYDSTIPVTLEDMIHHGRAVVRGAQRAHVVVDMPFGSYQTGWQDAMRNATRLMQETGAGSVKLEGGVRVAETVHRLVEAGIPVMGHVGLTPQSVNQFGGFKLQGKTPREAVAVLSDARALEEAGAYAVVLETVPTALAHMITQRVKVPTIGIGAGPFCSGQVQVLHDMLGLYEDFKPKHARRFVQGAQLFRDGLTAYREAVEAREFPAAAESFYMDERALALIERMAPPPAEDYESVDLSGDAADVLEDARESLRNASAQNAARDASARDASRRNAPKPRGGSDQTTK